MNRRQLLKTSLLSTAVVGGGGYATWKYFFDEPIKNPCQINSLPQKLVHHPLMQQALEGIDDEQVWDCHFHLIGNGLTQNGIDEGSGIYLNPLMTDWRSPLQRLQYGFYLNAACLNGVNNIDISYIENIQLLHNLSPLKAQFMLLAFDYYHDDLGRFSQKDSTFYVPNEYAAKIAEKFSFGEWIASVHPYRKDALDTLQWCYDNGAKAVKWLPPAMNIDPSSPRCEAFYNKLKELNLPLLTHAGEEKAVHSEKLQRFANPLLLRVPLDMGVKVIVAHCASLGFSEDFESEGSPLISNFGLFSRLMDDQRYTTNLLADISAINLLNRKAEDIRSLILNQHWHGRLLYASDYPLPGVMPLISSKSLNRYQLLSQESVEFLTQVRRHNAWLFDFLQKRLMSYQNKNFSIDVFHTRRHFLSGANNSSEQVEEK